VESLLSRRPIEREAGNAGRNHRYVKRNSAQRAKAAFLSNCIGMQLDHRGYGACPCHSPLMRQPERSVTVLERGRVVGFVLNRGVAGFEAFDAPMRPRLADSTPGTARSRPCGNFGRILICRQALLMDQLGHRPQSSSLSRLTADASGFFILSQSDERPER
jgi:hypothetical protein